MTTNLKLGTGEHDRDEHLCSMRRDVRVGVFDGPDCEVEDEAIEDSDPTTQPFSFKTGEMEQALMMTLVDAKLAKKTRAIE